MHTTEIPNFEELTDVQRVALAEEILSSVRSPEKFPAPLGHRAILDQRWAAYVADPSSGLSKEQFRIQTDRLKR